MAWDRPGGRPLSEPMMIRLLTHICVTRPQRINISPRWLAISPNCIIIAPTRFISLLWKKWNIFLWHLLRASVAQPVIRNDKIFSTNMNKIEHLRYSYWHILLKIRVWMSHFTQWYSVILCTHAHQVEFSSAKCWPFNWRKLVLFRSSDSQQIIHDVNGNREINTWTKRLIFH